MRNFSEVEFALEGRENFNWFRRVYLRYMRIEVGQRFTWGTQIYLYTRGNISIGDRSGLGSFARIWNYDNISIGDDVACAGGLTLNTAGHDIDTMKPIGAPITIGNRVWIGLNVTILGGVTIHDDAVIAAGSLVNKDVPPKTVVGGVPAKPIGKVSREPGSDFWNYTSESPTKL
ncbi:acyltransferase [Marivita geojedonensis]|uniref:acyltransferase n=1 Tax=Marivita geojedonensis TaxID=1123756 RepID=UPI0020131FE6|nr:acyltransferase [Marivita geojedonensis]